ncbi:MAG: AzlC family ABC transporter permease [Nitratireductor sp.]|nr:AzlC family ABC transporter permease [Nitratireductor sp.]
MNQEIRDGLRAAVPVIISAAPFGVLFGALAVDNGLSVFEAVTMSATVFAGASQMVGIELFGQSIAPWLIVFSVFAVNFRHVLYSAAIGRRMVSFTPLQKGLSFFLLTDPQFAIAEARYEAGHRLTFRWYATSGLALYVFWIAETWLGALFGRLLPDSHALGLDFLLTIYFLGLVMSFRKRALWLPVVLASSVASIIAFNVVGSPWHVSLGALAGILVAAAAPLEGVREDEANEGRADA